MDIQYRLSEDCQLFRELRGLSQSELAESLGMGVATINRWENDHVEPSISTLEKFYSNVYLSGTHINRIKEHFYREEMGSSELLLCHGAKSKLDGNIRVDASKQINDFGQGFYMGGSFRQAALFVSNYEESCVYFISFNARGLKEVRFAVDTKWMLTVACFRGRLKGRISEEKKKQLCDKVLAADYVVAPIADNRMYQIMDSFIDGEITDEQCRHALAATELGMQYVIKSDTAAKQVNVLERCYLCMSEKDGYVSERANDLRIAEDKVRAARIKYRGKGKYIDELL